MGINDLDIYQMAMRLGEQVWQLVSSWDSFAKSTVGNQVVRSADSVAANISEGFGRYHYKENIHHCYIARGSLLETRTWLDKAHRRTLIDPIIHQQLDSDINVLGMRLNAYIKSLGRKASNAPSSIAESSVEYISSQFITNWDTPTMTNDSEA